jgi:maltose alpha-D-glucosyltransferase / alpha-amylase
VMLKLFRRLTAGINPDLEIGRQLTEHESFAHVPKVAGALEYRCGSNHQFTVAILHEFVPNVGDAWTTTLDELGRYFERVQSQTPDALLQLDSPLELLDAELPPLAQETIGGYLSLAELLGRRTAELHVTLSKTEGGPAFAPEPFTRLYQRALYQSMRSQTRGTVELLSTQVKRLDEEAQELAKQAIEKERRILARLSELLPQRIDSKRIRCHGDLHLGQVLFTGKDFVIIDFEGEPERPVSERRIKASPLRDVASMLRSFHYVSHAALRGHTSTRALEHASISNETWAAFWSTWVSATFLRSYLAEARAGDFLPADRAQLRTLLAAYLLEKALYELRYELNNRPDWIRIPLEGILQLLQ